MRIPGGPRFSGGMASARWSEMHRWSHLFKAFRGASGAVRTSSSVFDHLSAAGVDVSAEYTTLLTLERKLDVAATNVHDLRTRSGSLDAAEAEDEDVAMDRLRRHASRVALRCGFGAFLPRPVDGAARAGNYAKNALLARCRRDVAFLLNVGRRLPVSGDLWKLCLQYTYPLKDLGYRGWRLQVALIGDDRAFVCIDGSYPFPAPAA